MFVIMCNLFRRYVYIKVTWNLSLIHTNVRVRENGCVREKDKYLNHLFSYNVDRYVKYVISLND